MRTVASLVVLSEYLDIHAIHAGSLLLSPIRGPAEIGLLSKTRSQPQVTPRYVLQHHRSTGTLNKLVILICLHHVNLKILKLCGKNTGLKQIGGQRLLVTVGCTRY